MNKKKEMYEKSIILRSKFCVDQIVFFQHFKSRTIVRAKIDYLNEATANVIPLSQYDGSPLKIPNRIRAYFYCFLKEDLRDTIFGKLPQFSKSSIFTKDQLDDLFTLVKNEYSHIFAGWQIKEKEKLSLTKIKWNNRYTYFKGGCYSYWNNEIEVSRSFRYVPIEVIKFVIYHEILHVKYRRHNKTFRSFEKQFKNFEANKRLFEEILTEIRFFKRDRIDNL